MGRKRKHKVNHLKPTGPKQPSANDEPAGKSKRSTGTIVLMVMAVLAIGYAIFSWVDFGWAGKDKAEVSLRKPFPAMPAKMLDKVVFEDFVGAEACSSCHADIYNKWKKSTHGQAGGSPEDVKIIGLFDGKPRRFKDAVLTPYRAANGDYMFNLKTDGLPEQVYKVDGVVGGGHMIAGGTQTYFSYFPDGTMRMLPFDFIRDEKVWFGETSKGEGWVPITQDRIIDKESEWLPSRVLGTHLEKSNCQGCHGSQIQLEYALDKKIFSTKFTTLAVNCESCHGPGKEHLQIVAGTDWKEKSSLGLKSLLTLDKEGSLETCFRCHSLKNSLQPGFLPGKDLEEFYSVKFPMLGTEKENPYHPDGRIKEFAYQLNHLSSDCYINGSMTCVSCHDPHEQSYRDVNGQVLASPFDDGQCTSCHGSKTIDIKSHTFHKIGSEGSKCVSCHMPYLQQQAIGEHLRFARSDHTIPIPRPAFDNSIGIETACVQCHKDKSIAFLQSKVEEWYGEIKPHNDMVERLIRFNPSMSLFDASDLLLPDSSNHAMGQMAGISQFAFNYLKPNMDLDDKTVSKIKNYVSHMNIDIQSVAMASLHLTNDNDDQIHNLLVDKLNQMDEANRRKVMKRWANALPVMAKKFEEKGSYEEAIEIYRKSLEIVPNSAVVMINMAIAYAALESNTMAMQMLDRAIKTDPNNYDAWLNKGNVLFKLQRTPEALAAYKQANSINPWNGSAYFNIGNCHYRNNNTDDAIVWYKKAVEIEPNLALGYFFLARSFIKKQDYKNALTAVRSGLSLDPTDEAGNQMYADLKIYFNRSN
ncbi:MAG TPA: hypothetical protein DIS90_12990 [Cytophagales bacterium]|nr:hypothetical protein [Cytophagales bacterium]HCR54673.1 hypothetical protein [Cytophagales bacterium]